MQSDIMSDRIIEARNFVTDIASQDDISYFNCYIGMRTQSSSFTIVNPDVNKDRYGDQKSIVPIAVREDYASQFVEWSFDDTVEYVELGLYYSCIALEVRFIGGTSQTWKYECVQDDDDEDLLVEVPTC